MEIWVAGKAASMSGDSQPTRNAQQEDLTTGGESSPDPLY